MCRPVRLLLLLLGLIAAIPASAAPPLLDAGAVPGLDAVGKAGYERFLRQNHPRAFAIDGKGRWGSAWGQAGPDEAAAAAVANCHRSGAASCRLYARNNEIVWQGQAWAAPSPPGRIAGGIAFEIVPDQRFLWWGVRDAAGAYVWGHGRSAGRDSRGQQPPPSLRWFNNAGWDVFRFDRHPASDDADRAAGWLREGILALRAAGYARVVVGGQSRGGWNALMMLAMPGLADAVVAIAPARHGDGAIGNPNYPRATDDFRAVLSEAADRRARVVIASFQGDLFVPDPDARSALVQTLLEPRIARLLWLDRPAGFDGHGAGGGWRFSDAFGRCIYRFVTLADPPASC
ncbi:MAG: hypothetical protein IT556_18480 [Acetobacteraceae bacterium]|nr:hypothetical protein [Acetobacteraceae bacterium]